MTTLRQEAERMAAELQADLNGHLAKAACGVGAQQVQRVAAHFAFAALDMLLMEAIVPFIRMNPYLNRVEVNYVGLTLWCMNRSITISRDFTKGSINLICCGNSQQKPPPAVWIPTLPQHADGTEYINMAALVADVHDLVKSVLRFLSGKA